MGHRDWHRFREWYIQYLCVLHGEVVPPVSEMVKISKSIDWTSEPIKMLEHAYTVGFYDGIKCNKEYDPLWDAA